MFARLLLAVAVVGLAACAAGPRMPERLEDRVEARWDALVANDWDTAYAYLSPGFRSAMSLSDYTEMMGNRTIRWLGAEVAEVRDCDDELGSCKVLVNVGYSVSRGVPGLKKPVNLNKALVENWIQADGAWYFVPDRLR